MWELLFWLYLINATLLVNHEIDSAYWKEWELFKVPGGIAMFLMLHLPLVLIVLWGVAKVVEQSPAGLVMSLILSIVGVGAFVIHSYFIKKGHPEFKTWMSLSILGATLVVSLVQGIVSVYALAV